MNIDITQNTQSIIDSIYVLQDWHYPIIYIRGRVYIIDGEIQMADSSQSVEEHFFYGKDITNYLVSNSRLLSTSQNREGFIQFITSLKVRKFRFHKDEKYIRYSV